MRNNKKVKYGKRKHSGGLQDSLNTSEYINENEFNELVKEYDYYAYDERCNQVLFIAKDMKREYIWLFIEIVG